LLHDSALTTFSLAGSCHSQRLPMSIKPLLPLPGKVAVSIAHGVKTVKMARASEIRLDRRPRRVKGVLTALPPGGHLMDRAEAARLPGATGLRHSIAVNTARR
jgi:hypothetical protein